MSKQSELRDAIVAADQRSKLATERDRDQSASRAHRDRVAEHRERQQQQRPR